MNQEGDKKEEFNIGIEESLSKALAAKIADLLEMSRKLSVEYAELGEISVRLADSIERKEQENNAELQDAENEGINTLRDQDESTISGEEANILQSMLTQLDATTKQGLELIQNNKFIHSTLRDIYKKDLSDFDLEIKK